MPKTSLGIKNCIECIVVLFHDTLIHRIASLFSLPRRFAPWEYEHVRGYDRKESRTLTPQVLAELIYDTPIAVSILNWEEAGYVDEQDFMVFDIDNPDDFEQTKEATIKIARTLEFMGIDRLICSSAGKGFHIFIFCKQSIPTAVASAFQRKVLLEAGFEQMHAEVYSLGRTNVETLIAGGAGKIVKIPFSIHPKYRTRREIPLKRLDVKGFDLDAPISDLDMMTASGLMLTQNTAPIERILEVIGLEPDARLIKPKRRRKSSTSRLPSFKMPDDTPRQGEIAGKIKSTPCLTYCYQIATSERGVYELRANIVTTLARAGFSRQDIAVFFRDNICDAEDLLNEGELERQINHWYPKNYHAQCWIFQEDGSPKFCCKKPCGRLHPAESPSEDVFPPASVVGSVWDFFGDIYQRGGNYQIYKTTRAKVTTQSIIRAVSDGKKILQVVPTQKITKETFPKTIEIARDVYNVPITGAVLTDVRSSCLKSKLEVEHYRRFHDTAKSAYEKLPFVQKHRCSKCKYRKDRYLFEPGTDEPIIDSDTTEGMKRCAHMSIIKHLDEFDVIVITYRKLLALISTVEAEARLGGSGGHAVALMDAIRNMDIIMLDEVSQFTDAPHHEVALKIIYKDKDEGYNFFDRLQSEIDYIKTWEARRIAAGRQVLCYGQTIEGKMAIPSFELEEFIREMRDDVVVYRRDVTEQEKNGLLQEFYHEHERVIDIAKEDDEALGGIIDMLVLIPELEWLIVSAPDAKQKVNVSVMLAPKVRDTVNFFHSVNHQVIATDGTMTIVDFNSLFGIPFEKVNIGDPEDTSKLARVVPDTENIMAPKIFDNEERLLNWITWANDLFGSDLIIATTNIDIHRKVKKMIKDMNINVNIMYHRSGDSIGVECAQRVMLNLCAPYTPRTAKHWLKVIYGEHTEGYTGDDVWEYDKIKTDFQTMSRVKDPHGKEPSVVICYGQDRNALKRALDKCVEPPKILQIKGADVGECPAPLRTAKDWLEEARKTG